MRHYRYNLLDVFTDSPFGGNPLAVFPDARDIDPLTMQAIAKEFNLSETTFVLPPVDQSADHRVRIFTPAIELPMAGHPTIGTAFVLAREHTQSQPARRQTTLRLEEGVGVIAITLDWNTPHAPRITMQQPLPTFGPRFQAAGSIAEILALDPAELRSELPIEVVSCGVPFLLVPVRDLRAIQRISLQQGLWQQALADFASPHILAFTQQTQTQGAAVHCRMFAPAMGIAEDPATGAANGPLGSYLVHYGLVPARERVVSLMCEQGFEMGRPSLMYITLEHTDGEIHNVSVGGHCVYMGEGELVLPDLRR
jgi:trans-2,3-dihydro-3-hydroxyanthranilate isomerase